MGILSAIFKRRKKTLDESISFNEALNLLSNLDSSTEIILNYSPLCGYNRISTTANPEEAKEFAKEKLGIDDMWKNMYYTGAYHQVFSGENDNKHILGIYNGRIKGKLGERIFKDTPSERLKLTYFTELNYFTKLREEEDKK